MGINEVYTAEKCDRDPQFQNPYIDLDEWRDVPARHRCVHGGFEGTMTKFTFYFPEKEKYKGRFFQRMMPVQGDEMTAMQQTGEEDAIKFGAEHGSIFIDTNMGGVVNGGGDETLVYRSSAACARYCRRLASEMYGTGRAYGYVFGGSGGGFKTMGCLESTEGIWDGGVPFVIGSPVAMPNVFTVRAHAMRILRHRFEEIADAVEPGGSGDPYAVLNDEEKDALREVTLMGFPMKSWCVWETLGDGALPVLYPAIPAMDPSYFTDFWTKPGYLGTEKDSSAVRDRIHLETVIEKIHHPERELKSIGDTVDEHNAYGVDEAWKNQLGKGGNFTVFELREFPSEDAYTRGLTITFLDGDLAGEKINVIWLGYSLLVAEPDPMGGRNLETMLKQVRSQTKVLVDNSDYIAVQTYHRHQVPGEDFHAWDQFRGEDGTPIYPQRPVQVGPIIARGGAGSVQSGRIHGKAIVLESLMDESAFPWQADWYRHEVAKESGKPEKENFRLYYMENCMHTDCTEGNGGDHQHIVSYSGALYQALLDLSDWVERGIEPRETSGYEMNGGQVLIAESAAERKGLQPLVKLTANGGKRAEVQCGMPVRFEVQVELPEGNEVLENVIWDFENTDEFAPKGTFSETERLSDGTGRAQASCEYCFGKPGTYFPVVKIMSNRTPGDFFTRIQNMDRVRVVVSE